MADEFVRETPQDHDSTAGQPLPEAEPGTRSLPTPSTPGYTVFTDYLGRRWTCCDCVFEWLTWAQRVAIKRGMLKQGFDVWQLTGGAPDSANTHSLGAAMDFLFQTNDMWVKFFRDNGVTGTWRRTVSQGFSKDHLHAVLRGCPHDAMCHYQLVEQKDGPPAGGGDGLTGTRPDYHADPVSYITWQTAVERFKRELAPVTPTTLTFSAFPGTIVKHNEVVLTAKVAPVNPGTFVFGFLQADGTSKTFRTVTAAAGSASASGTPGADVVYTVEFRPSDTTRYKGSKASRKVEVVDVLALESTVKQQGVVIEQMQRQIADLQNPPA